MHTGLGNIFAGIRWGKVVGVRRGESRGEGQGIATQWVADIEDHQAGGGLIIQGATVAGPRLPRVHTDERPSFAVWGTFNGNIQTPWCMPCPWTSCFMHDIGTHELLDEYDTMTIHLWVSPVTGNSFYTLKDPEKRANEGDGFANQRRFLQISWTPEGAPLAFEMLGGSRLMARAGTRDGGRGDYVVIDADTSPNFVAWQTEITAAVNALAAQAAALATGQAALAAQTAALNAYAAALPAAVAANIATGTPVPPFTASAAPVAPPAGPAAVGPPEDGVPEVDGLAPTPPAPFTTVGRIATGSPQTRGL